MLTALSFTGVIAALMIGYAMPRRAGWATLWILPLLGPAQFTFVPSGTLPLTTYRVAFAVMVGILLHGYSRPPVRRALKLRFIRLYFLFAGIVLLLNFPDRPQWTLFTYIPETLLGVFLCFALIRNKADLRRFVQILVWQAAVIGVLIIVEYYTDFSVAVWARSTLPDYDLTSLQTKGYSSIDRAGFYRAAGIDGGAVPTSYRLAFLFPLTLWYATQKNLLALLPLGAAFSGLVFLQTRAAAVGVAVGLMFLFAFLLIASGSLRQFVYRVRKLSKVSLIALLALLGSAVAIPTVFQVLSGFVEESVIPTARLETLDAKVMRIPVALGYLQQRPLLGYGSPNHVYFDVMGTDDIPGPLIYALAGGIGLGLLYVLLLAWMPVSLALLSRRRGLSPWDQSLLIYAAGAFASGGVVVFSNWVEGHFMVMFMLYVAIHKAYFPPWQTGTGDGASRQGVERRPQDRGESGQ